MLLFPVLSTAVGAKPASCGDGDTYIDDSCKDSATYIEDSCRCKVIDDALLTIVDSCRCCGVGATYTDESCKKFKIEKR